MKELTPREIMRELNRYIIGQDEAKRAVAIALRNRYRRAQLDEDIRNEISPKNILMIGPTGVGKTEIARRLAKLVNAPFVKVEATKFTEVGYVGRDVESIIRDLMENAVRMVRNEFSKRVEARASVLAEDRLASLLVNPPKKNAGNPFEFLLAINHENRIGEFRQLFKASQVAKHHFKVRFFTHRHNFEIHSGTDAIFRIAHGRAQLCPLFCR